MTSDKRIGIEPHSPLHPLLLDFMRIYFPEVLEEGDGQRFGDGPQPGQLVVSFMLGVIYEVSTRSDKSPPPGTDAEVFSAGRAAVVKRCLTADDPQWERKKIGAAFEALAGVLKQMFRESLGD